MALKDIFTMVKADRYTADGREEVIKAREAEIEDARRTYQNGEISEKTGLMKTPNGWVPPKETKFGKVKQNKEGQWGVQTKQGKGSDFLKHKSEKEASRALANYTAGYNTTERSKQDPHSNEARQVKQWNKETDKIRKENRAEARAEHASHFQSLQKTPGAQRGTKEFDKNEYIDSMKNSKNAPVSRMAREIQRETFDDEIKSTNGDKAKIESLTEKLLSPATESGIKISAESRENAKNLVESRYRQLNVSAESKPDAADQRDQIGGEIKGNLEAAKYYFDKAQSFSPTDPSYKTYMTKAKQYNDEAKAQADDNGFDFEEMHNSGITHAVNKYAEEQSKPNYQITEKGGKFYATGHQFKDGSQLHAGPFGSEEEVHKFMNNGVPYRTSKDSAPRILTGDTRIRVRKA